MGLGIPYGIYGANLDINVVHNLDLSLGGGLASIGLDPAYNLGLRYSFISWKDPSSLNRLRLSAYYGINSMLWVYQISYYGSSEERKTYEGFSFGIGMQQLIGKTKTYGFDFDIFYLETNRLDRDIEKLRNEGYDVEKTRNVKISFGFRFAFEPRKHLWDGF